MVGSLGQEDVADELIVRFVLAEAFAQPLVEGKDAFDADAIRVGPQQVGPLLAQ